MIRLNRYDRVHLTYKTRRIQLYKNRFMSVNAFSLCQARPNHCLFANHLEYMVNFV